MNLNQLRNTDYIIFEAVVGSQLYGLATPTSDTDTKGVFKLPNRELFKMSHPKQINDDTNDTVFYEVKRFLQLAQTSNPNILELLFIPKDKVLYKSNEYQIILNHRDKFITKAIRNSLGGYAISQIKKARGQNKKIVNPVNKDKKDLLDFCYILTALGSIPLKDWLRIQRIGATNQESYGAASVSNAHNMFYIYHDEGKYDFRGLLGDGAHELRMSSIPKECIAGYSVMYCNTEGYSTYCKEYKEYWDWVDKRNPVRYDINKKHGKGYDGKNLMHCFRLLEMGIEIAETGIVNVARPNREWLLKVRSGEFEYEDLVNMAEEKLEKFDNAINKCNLPNHVDDKLINDILLEIRFNSSK